MDSNVFEIEMASTRFQLYYIPVVSLESNIAVT